MGAGSCLSFLDANWDNAEVGKFQLTVTNGIGLIEVMDTDVGEGIPCQIEWPSHG